MSKAPAVDYALSIIEFFASKNSAVGIADISNGTGINKAAISRILEALREYGWIFCCDEEQKKYKLTLKPFSMLSKSINQNSLLNVAETYLKKMYEELGDSVYLGVRNGENVLYLLHYDSMKPVKISGCVGGEYPIKKSAPGKVLLAFSDDVSEDFKKQSETIKELGYAIDNEEFANGIICYAAPVYDMMGEVVASIGISSLTLYETMEELIVNKGKLISDCAKNISEALGYKYI